MAKLFEYTVIYNPKPRKDANGNDTTPKSELVIEPKWRLADSDKQVAMIAAREIPEQYLDKLDEVEVIIRPFA